MRARPLRNWKLNSAVAGVAVLLGTAVWILFPEKPPAAVAPIITQDAYIPPGELSNPPSPMRFANVTKESGVAFRHHSGATTTPAGTPTRFMPETMGPGVAVFDYNGDGLLDIFVVNSSDLAPSVQNSKPATPSLYKNLGGWRFEDVTQSAGLVGGKYGMGVAVADYDGDARPDLLLTAWGELTLMHNEGDGTFADVTSKVLPDIRAAGVPDWSTGAAFFDADQDGDLDLYVANYVRWTPDLDVFSTLDGKNKSYAVPSLYEGTSSKLLLQKDGVFHDATATSGMLNDRGKSLGVALWDFNDDGLLDIAVANDTQPNFLYYNLGEGRFENRALESGIAYDESGRTRAGMGIDIADIGNDGHPCIAIGNFSREPVSMFRSEGTGFFREVSQSAGVSEPSILSLTFGLTFADLDLDGWQDMVLANGHIEPEIQNTEAEVTYRQKMVLLGNAGSSRFVNWSDTAGEAFSEGIVGRGLALGDLDNDGDLDIVVTENSGPLHLLRNDLSVNDRTFLRIRLEGNSPNTDAIGAKIELVSSGGNLRQTRYVRGASSYLSHSEYIQTFGLGKDSIVDSLIVTWPGGDKIIYKVDQLNTTLVLKERDKGTIVSSD